MIHVSHGSARRILYYPAIPPCESIPPTTLLHSLIHHAHAISTYKSSFFSTNRRNARTAFRLVSNLLLFFEEIRDAHSDLPHDAVLSLSELHLAFQKLLSLLDDCTRPGARLWILLNSDQASNAFWVSVRTISTALDVFPFQSVHISLDAQELVNLVMRQSWISSFQPDPEDVRVLELLMRTLTDFQHDVAPDPEDLKRILNHLGIISWSDCHKEVKFLDSEITVEFLNPEKKNELQLLSSLTAFMTYCRGILFDSADSKGSQRVNANFCRQIPVTGINVVDLRCPISLEIMSDPVTLSTGQTYDRSSISKWLRSGNTTCPNTGERLANTDIVPNLAIKGIINHYFPGNGVIATDSSHKNRDASRMLEAGSSAAEGAMKLLARFLVDKLPNGANRESHSKAAFEIRVLTKTSIFNRSCLVEAGAIPHLLTLLLSEDPSTQEHASAGLLNLSKHQKSKAMMVENGGLELILNVLKKGLKAEAKQHAAGAIFYLASVEEYRAKIGQNPVTVPALVDLIKSGNDHCKKNALVAIIRLLSDPGNYCRVLASGLVPLLLDRLKDWEREDPFKDSLAVLAALAERVDGTVAILRRHGDLEVFLKILETCSASRAAKECCVSLLLAVCMNGGGDVVARLVKSHTLMTSLYSLLGGEGTSRACKKASALIRILHEFYERRSSSSPMAYPVLPRERFVHVR